jgi:hypothetical protein
MMRALVATNVLARREGTVLFVPVSADTSAGDAVVDRLTMIHAFATMRGLL